MMVAVKKAIQRRYQALTDNDIPKREREKQIFSAFIDTVPDFAGGSIEKWRIPDDEKEFPDVICNSSSGERTGVELGEWLNEGQMKSVAGMKNIQHSILEAIGDQGENFTKNIYQVLLLAKEHRVQSKDKKGFRRELFDSIKKIDRQWRTEISGSDPEGLRLTGEDLKKYSLLSRYVDAIIFLSKARYREPLPVECEWITFVARGGWFSEKTMICALVQLLTEKLQHYGGCGTGFHHLYLILYYDRGRLYNTPIDSATFKFESVGEAVKGLLSLANIRPFDDIFVFDAAERQVLKITSN